LTSLSLNNNSKYFGAVWVEDNAGNKSDSVWGNGIIVDLEAPNPGIVWDGFLSEDIDYTADSNLLYVQWSDFTDNQSIDYYEASIGSLDDTTNILDWQRANQLDNIQITGLNLSRGIQYFAYLRAADSASNISSGIRSDGIEFDNTPPDIKSIYPLFDSLQVLSVLEDDDIQISFNKPILKFGLNVTVTQDTAVNYELTKQDSGITISILDTLPSYETITVILDTAIAFNLLNYTDTIIFRSKLWGDLNNDYQLSVEDVLAFNQSWPHSSTDLGPVSGTPPFLSPSPDGELNLSDLSAFGKMWVWYYHEYSTDSLSSLYLSYDTGLTGTVSKNKINLSIPGDVYGAEIVFFNANQSMHDLVVNNLNTGAFNYSLSDSIQNSISFLIADKNGLDSTLTFSLSQDLPEDFISNVKYKFIDEKANQVSKGAGQLSLVILPDKFDVYQNYPNPFNAETIIRYDLPKSEDVSIKIYDIIGREIYSAINKKQQPGKNSFIWKGNNNLGGLVSSGMYFLQISAGKEIKRMKMILLK
ncbi:MAG: T9SS type A sorting domain-containing protein, partial [Candidatus Neomarinimicrobiota bacterium]|nr:T9SS type A sorting domain-containing protein [Candidatus Neomarinimicrobiota bacterium]